ncbi:SOS response-associated peptidase [Kaistella montana]|uniref:Abasic site processing protein n=1 Tax=Kaistella montana TaxID=1849733 RepID=A0ABW5K8H2_9FLAO|nr:SOS response-associated peptidase [Kaistella montana]MCQ4035060.1 SOS response-associated peptidase [Kaistella montana]
MCYFINTSLSEEEIENSYNVRFDGEHYQPTEFLNGFSHSLVPVILDEDINIATTAYWGLIPFWAKNKDIRKQTLNAKIETIKEKPSYRNNYNKRCLVLVKGFYEWKWLDDKGKEKNKHFLTVKDQEIFSLGGIYSHWTDTESGKDITTFSIVTTEANELMAEIHNTKHRMPIVLNKSIEMEWLKDRAIEDFAFPNHESELLAINLDASSDPKTLF